MAEENNWVESLPENGQGWQETKTAESPEQLWEQMTGMRERMGSSIRIPSEEAGAEDMTAFVEKLLQVPGVTRIPEQDDNDAWAAFYDRLGRPGKPEEYEFDASEEEKAFYHGLGLTEAQAARLVEDAANRKKAGNDTAQASIKDEYNALMKEWGDGASRKMGGIKHVLKKFDESGALIAALEDPTFAYAPAMLRTLGNMGDRFLEKAPPGANVGGSYGITPQEARERANEMLHNTDSPRNNPNHPNHAAAQQEYMKLRRIATGEARA